MRPLSRRPGRRRDPRRGAGRRPLAPPAAVPRHDEPLVRRPQREQARRHTRPRRARRSRAGAGAARVGGRVDRDGAAGDPGGAGPRRRRRAGPQSGARDHVDHRLRPERRLPRLGRQRRDPGRHERDPQPLGPDRARTAAHAAGAGVRDDRDPGRVGDARGLLEPPGDRTRRSRRLLDPRGGDPDHGPRLRRRLGQSRVRLPLHARASGGRPLPDLLVRGRLRARRRARAAPVAGHARVARRARRVPGRALRHDPGAAGGSGRVARAVRRAVRR